MKKLVYLLLFPCILTACQDKDVVNDGGEEGQSSLSVSSTAVTFGQSSGSETIRLSASGNWTATVASNASSWCSIDAASGDAGENALTITVTENTTYDERNASITVVCGTARAIVTVTQKQKDALIIDSNKIELGAEESDFSITAKANVSVTYKIADDAKTWIGAKEEEQTRGLQETGFSFTAAANTDISPRQGTILLEGDNGLSETVTVYQQGGEPVLLLTSRDSLIVSDSGGTLKIELQSNVEYEMLLSGIDWIDEDQTRAVSTYTHYLDVSPNENNEYREAELVVRSLDKSLSDTVTIGQVQKGAVILAKSSYNVSWEETVMDFPFNSDADFSTAISVDWISESGDDAAGTGRKLSFKVEENPTSRQRTGTISLTYGDVVQTITIVQEAGIYTMRIVLTHSESELSPLYFQGNDVSGKVDWGDGTKSNDLSEKHVFGESGEKTSVFETAGADQVYIETLNTISSIIIYCDDED